MTDADLLQRMGALVVREFLPRQWCQRTARKMPMLRAASPALVHREGEYAIDESARKTKIVRLPQRIANRAQHRVTALRARLAEHFGIPLGEPEKMQWLGYRPGDFFRAHRDSNPAQTSQPAVRTRKVSVVLFLNDGGNTADADYEGGQLVLYGMNNDPAWDKFGASVEARAGMLIAFPSGTRHEVTQVTRGYRATAVTWFPDDDIGPIRGRPP